MEPIRWLSCPRYRYQAVLRTPIPHSLPTDLVTPLILPLDCVAHNRDRELNWELLLGGRNQSGQLIHQERLGMHRAKGAPDMSIKTSAAESSQAKARLLGSLSRQCPPPYWSVLAIAYFPLMRATALCCTNIASTWLFFRSRSAIETRMHLHHASKFRPQMASELIRSSR